MRGARFAHAHKKLKNKMEKGWRGKRKQRVEINRETNFQAKAAGKTVIAIKCSVGFSPVHNVQISLGPGHGRRDPGWVTPTLPCTRLPWHGTGCPLLIQGRTLDLSQEPHILLSGHKQAVSTLSPLPVPIGRSRVQHC